MDRNRHNVVAFIQQVVTAAKADDFPTFAFEPLDRPPTRHSEMIHQKRSIAMAFPRRGCPHAGVCESSEGPARSTAADPSRPARRPGDRVSALEARTRAAPAAGGCLARTLCPSRHGGHAMKRSIRTRSFSVLAAGAAAAVLLGGLGGTPP